MIEMNLKTFRPTRRIAKLLIVELLDPMSIDREEIETLSDEILRRLKEVNALEVNDRDSFEQ